MSLERGRAAFNFELTDMVPRVEWYWPMSTEAYLNITGIDPAKDVKGAALGVIEKLELDFSWGGIPDPSSVSLPGSDFAHVDPQGDRLEPWGVFSTKWRKEGAHLRVGEMANPGEVFEYDVNSYEERSATELSKEFQRIHDRNLDDIGDRLLIGEAFYTTLFHWFLGLFGWRATVSAGMKSPSEFSKQAKKFAELSRRHVEAWSKVRGLEVFISHDDICMSNGPIFSPKWYRKYIFPHYPYIWEPMKEKGIPVVFCSDGDVTRIMGDVFEAGADGFIFEPYVDLEWAAKNWGGKKVLIGNVDTRLLTGGTPEQAAHEVERCVSICGDVPGYFLNAGGQLPHTIPWENLRAYLDACRRLRKRDT